MRPVRIHTSSERHGTCGQVASLVRGHHSHTFTPQVNQFLIRPACFGPWEKEKTHTDLRELHTDPSCRIQTPDLLAVR